MNGETFRDRYRGSNEPNDAAAGATARDGSREQHLKECRDAVEAIARVQEIMPTRV